MPARSAVVYQTLVSVCLTLKRNRELSFTQYEGVVDTFV